MSVGSINIGFDSVLLILFIEFLAQLIRRESLASITVAAFVGLVVGFFVGKAVEFPSSLLEFCPETIFRSDFPKEPPDKHRCLVWLFRITLLVSLASALSDGRLSHSISNDFQYWTPRSRVPEGDTLDCGLDCYDLFSFDSDCQLIVKSHSFGNTLIREFTHGIGISEEDLASNRQATIDEGDAL